MEYFLGVDAGGTKTLALICDAQGQVLGIGMAGTGNFQGPGVEQARQQVQHSIELALSSAGLRSKDITSSFFGMAGADRPRDFQIVQGLLEPIVPSPIWGFENDAVIGLFAGECRGAGVGVICGTGTNVVGVNSRGERLQIGGMGSLFGDKAGGSYIGMQAIARAMRGHEGRGEKTLLYQQLCQLFNIDELLSLVDQQYSNKRINLSELAPLVFTVASLGDQVARQILIDVGTELAISANAALKQLFPAEVRVSVIAMGSVFQKATYPLMYDTFCEVLKRQHEAVDPAILKVEPVLGAVYGALYKKGLSVSKEFQERLRLTFPGRPGEDLIN